MTKQKVCCLSGNKIDISEQEMRLFAKMGINEPIHAPKIRSAMRLAFRNERNLYMRRCDLTGERIMSIYHEKYPFPVYKYDYWIDRDWDVPHINYDPKKSFFDQYKELSNIAPRPNLFAPYNENCDYCNAAEKNKNCYMIFTSDRCEDCYYGHAIFACRDCIDVAYLINSELCYECVDCRTCYHCRSCFLCDNSSNISFCFDMRGCSDCFMCYGLRNKKFCINNEEQSPEEYKKKMAEINIGSYSVFNSLKKKFIEEIVKKQDYTRMINTENSDGNFLINCKNCHNCYDVEDGEDCRYLRIGSNHLKDVIDSHAIVDGSELIYGNVSTTESYNCHNVIGCWTTKDSCYSEFLQGCTDCIGCISLRYKKNCIFNKQYSKQEYENLKHQIIDQLGDYYGLPFPFKCAPFTYLDSTFGDYDHMTKEEVEKIGWIYGDEEGKPNGGDYNSVNEIIDDISDLSGDELHKTFLCEKSQKPFKIIPQEIRLLQKIGAPLPHNHHETRFQERVQFRK